MLSFKKMIKAATVFFISVNSFFMHVYAQNLTYKSDTNVKEVRDYLNNNPDKNFKILFDNEIESINAGAFTNCVNLVSVSMPGIMNIGTNAFSGCINLKDVYMPQAQHVGNNAFFGCSLNLTITIGNSNFSKLVYRNPSGEILGINADIVDKLNNTLLGSDDGFLGYDNNNPCYVIYKNENNETLDMKDYYLNY